MMAAILSLRDAVSFLTILPLPCALSASDATVRMTRALAWFPLVGAGVGLVGAATILTTGSLPPVVSALLGLAAMAILTGGLHLDGFADTVDGLSVPREPEAALKIMQDPNLGALGVVSLILLLSLKWAILLHLPAGRLVPVLVTACAFSRWAMVVSAQLFPYVPGKEGLGKMVTGRKAPLSVATATFLTLGWALWVWGPLRGLLVTGWVLLGTGLLNGWFLSRLKGITGDTLGSVNEAVEVGILLFLVAG